MPIEVPDFDPLPNVGSQIERALANWFVLCGIGDASQNHVTNDNTDRLATSNPPCNTIMAHQYALLVPESGIEAWQVRIESEFPAAAQADQADTAWNWKQINLWIGKIMASLSLRNEGDRDFLATAKFITDAGRALAADTDPKIAANNADMADFTCLKIIHRGGVRVGKTPEGGIYFVEQRNFEIHAVPYNAD